MNKYNLNIESRTEDMILCAEQTYKELCRIMGRDLSYIKTDILIEVRKLANSVLDDVINIEYKRILELEHQVESLEKELEIYKNHINNEM